MCLDFLIKKKNIKVKESESKIPGSATWSRIRTKSQWARSCFVLASKQTNKPTELTGGDNISTSGMESPTMLGSVLHVTMCVLGVKAPAPCWTSHTVLSPQVYSCQFLHKIRRHTFPDQHELPPECPPPEVASVSRSADFWNQQILTELWILTTNTGLEFFVFFPCFCGTILCREFEEKSLIRLYCTDCVK